jgi:HTH-type transcriptional regulator/antitoxin HigA
MNIKIIKTREEYEEALEQLAKWLDREFKPGTPEEDALELLLLVIKEYENRTCELREVDPITAIKFRMEQMQLTRKDLIPFLGSLSRVSEVLSGDRGLSLSMIHRLHEGLGIPYESLIKRKTVSSREVKRKKITSRLKRRKPIGHRRRKKPV